MKKRVKLAILVIVLILIAGGIYWYFTNKQKNKCNDFCIEQKFDIGKCIIYSTYRPGISFVPADPDMACQRENLTLADNYGGGLCEKNELCCCGKIPAPQNVAKPN